MARRIHHAAERQVRSGNIAPFASRKLLVSLLLRLCLRTSRTAGLIRLAVAGARMSGPKSGLSLKPAPYCLVFFYARTRILTLLPHLSRRVSPSGARTSAHACNRTTALYGRRRLRQQLPTYISFILRPLCESAGIRPCSRVAGGFHIARQSTTEAVH